MTRNQARAAFAKMPPENTREGRIARAVFTLLNPPPRWMIGNCIEFLMQKGLTDAEITEAMDLASGGALTDSARAA